MNSIIVYRSYNFLKEQVRHLLSRVKWSDPLALVVLDPNQGEHESVPTRHPEFDSDLRNLKCEN